VSKNPQKCSQNGFVEDHCVSSRSCRKNSQTYSDETTEESRNRPNTGIKYLPVTRGNIAILVTGRWCINVDGGLLRAIECRQVPELSFPYSTCCWYRNPGIRGQYPTRHGRIPDTN
jgi:hypothetical protein